MNYRDAIGTFFDEKLPRLAETYSWKIPTIDGFDRADIRSYQANVALKNFLSSSWQATKTIDEKVQVAELIIKKWGGIKANNPETLEKYINEIKNHPNIVTPLQGVASYSKLFSIVHPADYAIYDSRVAACLNATQALANVKDGMAFNYVSGRNNIIGNAEKKIGFVYDDRYKKSALLYKGWTKIKLDETYATYIKLLKSYLIDFPQYQLYDLEMALFSNAEDQCQKALDMV